MKIISEDQAESELQNWGRHMHDGFLRDILLYAVPPMFEHYRADIVAFDDPEPARPSIDELAAQRTEDIVVRIRDHDVDSFMVLSYWYPRLMMIRSEGVELSHQEAISRLSKVMHTSFGGAQRLLESARFAYRNWRI